MTLKSVASNRQMARAVEEAARRPATPNIFSSVLDEVLNRVRRNTGGVLPSSSLVQAPPPAVTMAMLASLKRLEDSRQ